MRNEINLREEFQEFMDEYGHYVLLHRAGRDIHCRCWDEHYRQGDAACPLCSGSGWVGRIERHQARRNNALIPVNRMNIEGSSSLGPIWNETIVWMLKHDAAPRVGDFLYEVGWSGQKPANLLYSYRISNVLPQRGDNGRIEYWNVATKSENLHKDVKNIMVRGIGPMKNYELLK